MAATAPLPRHDFYQTPEHVIVAVYIKGLNAPGIKETVDISFESNQVLITRPDTEGEGTVKLWPLHATIKPDGSTSRILSTKIELKLLKVDPQPWPTLLGDAQPTTTSEATSPAALDVGMADSTPHIGGPAKINNKRKNWDRVVADELKEKKEDRTADPNSGGDDALQKMFAGIYKDADPDTKRAMIKSFTESGGTTLSTDWASIGKEKTPIRPPDGMEARKY